MRDRRIWIGVALGLAAALWLLQRGGAAGARGGTLLSDADGAVRDYVVQYVPAAAPIVTPAYRSFLQQLPAYRTVHVVCPDQAAFDELVAAVGPVKCRLNPILVGHAITCWSRDRWLALDAGDAGVTVLTPADEEGREVWLSRAGDKRVGQDLAESIAFVTHRRNRLEFDGGDFVADQETVFITPRVAKRNGATTPEARALLAEEFEWAFGRKAVLLETAPPYHAGMFMMLTGNRTAIVGEPVAGPIPGSENPDRAPFDAVADRLAEEGYKVHRIKVVPGSDGRTWMTFVNVIIDREGEKKVVYMPVYRPVPELNNQAEAVWQSLGFTVRRVDCTETYQSFGSLRCLVSVLRR